MTADPDDGVRPIRAGRRTVEIQRPGKVLFPGTQDAKEYTKGDLADYYRSVARYLLPHLRGRPLMLERHPDGLDGARFMQKNTPDDYPDWITRAEVAKEGGTVTHVVCDDTATLVYLADQACLTLHRWLSRTDRAGGPDHPDRLVFDLDPPGDDFAPVRQAAGWLHELLDELGLPAAPMTTGSRGLHLVVPLNGRHDFDEVRPFAHEVAEFAQRAHPDRLTTAARKDDRGDRLYLDVQRNAYAQTAVAPYSVRALPGAPVAVPLSWDQVDDPGVDARRWTVAVAVADAVGQARTDPWGGLAARGRALDPARRRLASLR
ncbi:ATP-dependent DNA ligase [Streptomyces cellostaticus]|uniref:ATP-dependent DNA ligase n=1 Tax=Streptomyces cellostaticus TaxID=67285 RepID=A0A117PY78_9ACTN|nr:non-homologous end-joining DNA ligase [Streptomyces cellostaticus]KUM98602.1 ATP-dependent DNA ligase [Streptomyces cellostaticus]GHI02978.1 ATP-dependent DNA ligase [Streptomyces cellostaticus]